MKHKAIPLAVTGVALLAAGVAQRKTHHPAAAVAGTVGLNLLAQQSRRIKRAIVVQAAVWLTAVTLATVLCRKGYEKLTENES